MERGRGHGRELREARRGRRERRELLAYEERELTLLRPPAPGGSGCVRLRSVAVDPHEQARAVADELERAVAGGVELLRVEADEHPPDRRRLVGGPAGSIAPETISRSIGARHGDVVEAQALGPLGLALGLAHLLVLERGPARARRRVGDAEAEAAVRQAKDLVGRGRVPVAARVGHDHDLELEPLRRVDGEQPHRVRVLLLGDGLELARADGLLLADEAHEALDVAAAQLLVGAREPGELAHVRVAPAPVPLREDGEVVVVVGDDPLAEPLQREAVRRGGEPLVALEETPGRGASPRRSSSPGSPRSNGRKSGRLVAARRRRTSASFESPTNGEASTVTAPRRRSGCAGGAGRPSRSTTCCWPK